VRDLPPDRGRYQRPSRFLHQLDLRQYRRTQKPRNPYYKQTNSAADPQGFNPAGNRYVNLGLGAVLYPERGLPAGNIGPGSDGRGDFLEARAFLVLVARIRCGFVTVSVY
jgi:hypothetical protein